MEEGLRACKLKGILRGEVRVKHLGSKSEKGSTGKGSRKERVERGTMEEGLRACKLDQENFGRGKCITKTFGN